MLSSLSCPAFVLLLAVLLAAVPASAQQQHNAAKPAREDDDRKGPRLEYKQGPAECLPEEEFRGEVAIAAHDGIDHLHDDSPDVVRVSFEKVRGGYRATIEYTDATGAKDVPEVQTSYNCEILARWVASSVSNTIPRPPPPEGFALWLHVKGEHPTCPAEYPAHMVFYQGVKDERGCEDCQCSPQQGAECMALFQVFSDAVCGALAGAVIVTDQDDSCFDLDPGTALASAEASMVVDVPGSCAQSGGAPFGGVLPADPLTLCCQGTPEPPG